MNFEHARFNRVEQQLRPGKVLNLDVLDLLFVVKSNRPYLFTVTVDAGIWLSLMSFTVSVVPLTPSPMTKEPAAPNAFLVAVIARSSSPAITVVAPV